MREVFREQPLGRFPDPFDPAAKPSFVAFAVTPSGVGPAPLAARLIGDWMLDRPRLTGFRRLLARLVLRAGPGEASETGPGGLAPLAGKILARRPDVRAAFARPAGGFDAAAFLGWLSTEGVRQHALKPAWCRRWGAFEAPAVVAGLLDLYDRRPDLQRRFPLAFVTEHDAPSFLADEGGVEDGSGPDADRQAAVRALASSPPFSRIRRIVDSRPDVAAAFPDGLTSPADGAFISWLRYSGRLEYGITEDDVLWFERERATHPCPAVQRAWKAREDLREGHPDGLGVLGRARFLAWLKEHTDALPGVDVSRLRGLCAPREGSPLAEIELALAKGGSLAARFPGGLRSSAETDALLSHLEAERKELGLEAEWLTTLRTELRAAGRSHGGACVMGYLGAESGMGELARATLRALAAVDYPVSGLDVEDAPQRQGELPLANPSGREGQPFTIVHMNAPEALRRRDQIASLGADGALIGYWAWELSEMPSDWAPAFDMYDEVWTCSRFAAEALAVPSPVPVHVAWPAIGASAPVPFSRTRMGVPADHFTFLFLYDFLSETERKNPLGLIAAFREAFRADDRVQLLLKTTNGALRPDDRAALADAARGLPVEVVDRYLTRPEVLGLIQDCDAYVSLHRSEGFGFTLAEAMWLGRPVVATLYSGNVDFMTPWNSFAVPYRLVEIAQQRGPYRVGAHWAEPDREAAAACLRAVRHEKERAAEVARRGQADVRLQLSAQACGTRMVRRLQFLSAFDGRRSSA